MNTETKPFLDYIHALEKELAAGNATEHTHRPALKTLLEAGSTGVPLVEKGPGAGSACESFRVYINKDQYFEGVPPEIWNFHIGGYQVCQKWLKDRKGRILSYDDITHYQKIIVALKETIRLMAEIDALIPGWPIG